MWQKSDKSPDNGSMDAAQSDDENAWRRLHQFLNDWYGPPARPGEMTPARATVGDALNAWHEMAAQWKVSVANQNQVLNTDAIWTEGGKVVFYVENQGVWLWAAGTQVPPHIYERENVDQGEWTPTGESLAQFFLHMAWFEAVMGAPVASTLIDVTAEQLEAVSSRYSNLECRPWRFPGPAHQLWHRPGSLLLSCANQQPDTPITEASTFSVFIGAQDPSGLAFLSEVDVDWDYRSNAP
jgi:hypothetical protein